MTALRLPHTLSTLTARATPPTALRMLHHKSARPPQTPSACAAAQFTALRCASNDSSCQKASAT